ncbi:hypothetical protein [Dinoroseobacter sp. S124A]|uniref:hypothetical protein n=1 Tax=Dinoroseobacter sp. S124A TaxID=3415128 RepID=UPI003C7E5D1F
MAWPRWLWFLPLGIIVLILAANGVRLGSQRAALDESAVIDHYAAQYLKDHAALDGTGSADLTDCAAVPGTDPGIWVVVRCRPEGAAQGWDYYVRRDGGLAFTGRDRDQRPET